MAVCFRPIIHISNAFKQVIEGRIQFHSALNYTQNTMGQFLPRSVQLQTF